MLPKLAAREQSAARDFLSPRLHTYNTFPATAMAESIMDDLCDVSARGGDASAGGGSTQGGAPSMRCVDDNTTGGAGAAVGGAAGVTGGGVPVKGGAPMSRTMRAVLIAATVVVAILIICAIAKRMKHKGEGFEWSPLAQKLAAAGWVLSTRDGCGFCETQLTTLGGRYPNMMHCSSDGKLVWSTKTLDMECKDIPGFPFWYNTQTKKTQVGAQSTAQLEAMV